MHSGWNMFEWLVDSASSSAAYPQTLRGASCRCFRVQTNLCPESGDVNFLSHTGGLAFYMLSRDVRCTSNDKPKVKM